MHVIAVTDWLGVGLGILGSLVVGILLWFLLPRGVVLTKRWATEYGTGAPVPEAFTITNDSALPIEIIGVDGPGFTTGQTWEPYPNPTDANGYSTIRLSFDDMSVDLERERREPGWKGVRIPPGETMTAVVPGIMALRIRYRRAGWSGALERRSLTITHLS